MFNREFKIKEKQFFCLFSLFVMDLCPSLRLGTMYVIAFASAVLIVDF